MADLTSTTHRQYSQNAGTDLMRRTAITPGPHWTPTYKPAPAVTYDINIAEMLRINQEFIDAGAADDNERPLCMRSFCLKLENHRGRCLKPNG